MVNTAPITNLRVETMSTFVRQCTPTLVWTHLKSVQWSRCTQRCPLTSANAQRRWIGYGCVVFELVYQADINGILHHTAISSNKTTILNEEQGSYYHFGIVWIYIVKQYMPYSLFRKLSSYLTTLPIIQHQTVIKIRQFLIVTGKVFETRTNVACGIAYHA